MLDEVLITVKSCVIRYYTRRIREGFKDGYVRGTFYSINFNEGIHDNFDIKAALYETKRLVLRKDELDYTLPFFKSINVNPKLKANEQKHGLLYNTFILTEKDYNTLLMYLKLTCGITE